MRSVLIMLICATLCSLFLSCGLEQSLDRYGQQMLQHMEERPVTLVEVRENLTLPPELPYADTLQQQPLPRITPDAPYPETMRRARKNGSVAFVIIIDSTGAIGPVTILHATDTSFARSVRETVTSWKIEPGKMNGTPVSSYKRLTLDFMLQ